MTDLIRRALRVCSTRLPRRMPAPRFSCRARTPMRTAPSSGGSTTKGMKSATIPGRTGDRPRPPLALWRRRHLAPATCCAPWLVWKRTCSGLHTASSHPRSWFGSGHSGRPSSYGASIRVMSSSSLLKRFVGWFEAHPPRPGDIILLHDKAPVLREGLPHLLSLIKSRGLRLATPGEWIDRRPLSVADAGAA